MVMPHFALILEITLLKDYDKIDFLGASVIHGLKHAVQTNKIVHLLHKPIHIGLLRKSMVKW